MQVYEMQRYIDRNNRHFKNVLQSIQHNDFSFQINENKESGSAQELAKEINKVTGLFSALNKEKDDYRLLIDHVLNRVPLAVVVCQKNVGEAIFFNALSKKLVDLSIKKYQNNFFNLVTSTKEGEKLVIDDEDVGTRELHFNETEFIMRSNRYSVFTIQDLKEKLEEQELASWSSLIKILTHEIMNSLTPITSLSGTSKEMYNTWSIENQLTPDIDILTALDTIENRSKGLMQFVKAYRLMAKVPEPQKVVIQLDKMLRKIKSMFDVNQNSNLIISVDSTMTIFADEQLIEQVMINVIKNAEESLQNSDQKDIVVSASANANQMLKIEVQDNGCGIEDELLDQIFIPFFTTKSNGSGIGLSLSKQIMRMHQGNIEINRRAQGGTTVSICLPLH